MKAAKNSSSTLIMLYELKNTLTKTQYKKCKSFIRHIMNLMIYKESNEWVSIPSRTCKSKFGDDYPEIRRILKNAGIIEVNEQYSEKQCKRFKISDAAFKKGSTKDIAPQKTKTPNSYLEKHTHNSLKMLSCNSSDVYDFIENYIESSEFKDRVKVIKGPLGDRIKVIMDQRSGRTGHFTIQKARIIARKKGKSLIQDGDKYYMVNKKEYIARKKIVVRECYKYCVECIENQNWFPPKRNKKDRRDNKKMGNLRLDSAITNMPNVLLQFFNLEGEGMNSFDLSNSQIVLLVKLIDELHSTIRTAFSSVLERTKFSKEFKGFEEITHTNKGILDEDDFILFKNKVRNGEIYKYMAERMKIKIKEAKLAMLRFQYSAYKASSMFKNEMKKLFPSVVRWIDSFKKKYGKSDFAKLLQRIEAQIFIDKILRELCKKKISCLSKHDSILCKKSDKDRVEKLMTEILDLYLGESQYVLKEE